MPVKNIKGKSLVLVYVVTKTGNDHKRPQTTRKQPQTTTNDQQTTTNNHKRPANDHKQPQTTNNQLQTTNKRLQTTNKRTLTTSKRPQTATRAHQTKNLTFRFFFPHPVITRNIPILKNILFTSSQCKISGGGGGRSE